MDFGIEPFSIVEDANFLATHLVVIGISINVILGQVKPELSHGYNVVGIMVNVTTCIKTGLRRSAVSLRIVSGVQLSNALTP